MESEDTVIFDADVYRCNGYAHCIKLARPTLVRFSELVDGLIKEQQKEQSTSPQRDLVHFVNLEERNGPWNVLKTLLSNRSLCGVIESLIGSGGYMLRMEVYCKAPGGNGELSWHQDTFHTWGDYPIASSLDPTANHPTTLWLALDDVEEKNGAMEMAVGSHTALLDMGSGGPLSEMANPVWAKSEKRIYCFSAGEGGLHSSLCVHRSVLNKSNRYRRAIIVRFLPSSAAVQEALAKANWQPGAPLVVAGEEYAWVAMPPSATKKCPKNTPLMLIRRP